MTDAARIVAVQSSVRTHLLKSIEASFGSKVQRKKPTSDKNTKSKETSESEQKEQIAPKPIAAKLERREKVNRRRQIDPTTCEREYSDQEVEFMQALDLYKRQNGRMFPTCSEVLEVIRSLGYKKVEAGMAVVPASQVPSSQLATLPTCGSTGLPKPHFAKGSSPTNGLDTNEDILTSYFLGASEVVETTVPLVNSIVKSVNDSKNRV